ncbi:MAG: hypothetical protein IPH88_00950 [Bacteroidales bacterium]|nr:hypothetical protein [Bacteroidales bacterium]
MKWQSVIAAIITITIISNICIAQNYEFKRGELIKFSSNKCIRKSLHADSSGYYLHVTRNEGVNGHFSNYLVKVDTSFSHITETELPIRTTNLINEMFFVAGRFIWLHSEFDNTVNSRIYRISILGLDGKVSGTIPLDSLLSGDLSNKSIGIIVTPDRKSFLFYNSCEFSLSKMDRKIRIIAFDSTLNRVMDKELKQELIGISTKVEGFTLNNDLSAQIICKYTRGQETGKCNEIKDLTPGGYFLLSTYPGDEHTGMQVITGKDIYTNSCYLLRDDQKKLHCIGFFSRSESGKSTAFFDFKVDRNGADTAGTKYELSKEEIAQCFFKPSGRNLPEEKTKFLDPDFLITDIITNEQGVQKYIAQSSTLNSMLIMSSMMMVVSKYHVSKNIVVFSINDNQKIDTIILIPKYQSSSFSDASLGYLYFKDYRGLNFLYNESARNMRRPLNERSLSYNYQQKGIPAWVELGITGLCRYSIPAYAAKESPVFLIKHSYKISDNEYFVVLQDTDKPKIGKYYLGKINLKN